MCPLFRGSTVHKEEDNLSIVDKMAGPNVSFIQRMPCLHFLGQGTGEYSHTPMCFSSVPTVPFHGQSLSMLSHFTPSDLISLQPNKL